MIEVTGLQADHAVGHVNHTRCNAVRSIVVDDGDIALLPQEATERLCGTNEEEVIEFVEVPLVEKELVEATMGLGQTLRRLRRLDVHVPGGHETKGHGEERAPL